jgi:hypothetical protein
MVHHCNMEEKNWETFLKYFIFVLVWFQGGALWFGKVVHLNVCRKFPSQPFQIKNVLKHIITSVHIKFVQEVKVLIHVKATQADRKKY